MPEDVESSTAHSPYCITFLVGYPIGNLSRCWRRVQDAALDFICRLALVTVPSSYVLS